MMINFYSENIISDVYYLIIICLSLKIIDYELAVYSFVLHTSVSFKI